MPRVKRGVVANQRRKKLRKYAKGYRHGRNSKIRRMNEALLHAFSHMFKHRKEKKGDFRTMWNMQINAGARMHDTTYSTLIGGLKKNNIALNRKMLAELANTAPQVFAEVINKSK